MTWISLVGCTMSYLSVVQRVRTRRNAPLVIVILGVGARTATTSSSAARCFPPAAVLTPDGGACSGSGGVEAD